MKYGKEEVQKMVLGGLMFAALIYCYFALLLGPLSASGDAKRKKIDQLTSQALDARKQIKKVEELEKTAPTHAVTYKQIVALIPEGSPVAWFPVRVAEIFKQYGLEKVTTKLSNEVPDKEIPGFKRLFWTIEVNKAYFHDMAQALSQFENEELLATIDSIEVTAGLEDVETQRMVLSVNSIVKQ